MNMLNIQNLPNVVEVSTDSPACQHHSGVRLTTHPFALYYEAMDADNAWQDELDRQFGKCAGDARYDKRGISTPTLVALRDEFRRKLDIWMKAMKTRQEVKN